MSGYDPSSSIRISRMLNMRRPPVALPKLSPIADRPLAMPKIAAPRIARASGGIIDSPAAPFTGPIVTAGGGRTDDVPMHVPSGAYVLPADVVSHIGEGNSLAGLKLLTMMFGAPWKASGGPLGAAMPQKARGAGVREPALGRPNAPYPAMAAPMPKPGAMFAEGGAPEYHGPPEYGPNPPGAKPEKHPMTPWRERMETIFGPGGDYLPRTGDTGTLYSARGGHVEKSGDPTPIMASGGEFVISPEEVQRRGGGDISKGHKALDAWVVHLRKKSIDTLKKLPGPAK